MEISDIQRELKGQPILVYDIETATPMGKPTPSKDILRVFGAYSYLKDRTVVMTNKDEIRKFITGHKFFVGFNHMGYDNIVMHNCGFNDLINLNERGNQISGRFVKSYDIDLMRILHPKHQRRAGAMKIDKGNLGDLLMSFGLDNVTKVLGLVDDDDGKIQDFDYKIFNKPKWTKEESLKIIKYAKRDVEITKKLYEWMEKYFWSFRSYLNQKDIYGKKYLTSTIAVYAYKVICNRLGIKEEYESGKKGINFDGGYVALPTGESFEGNIILLDFSSLYPNLFIMANLHGHNCTCCSQEEKWHGDGFFKVEGYYCRKKLSPLSQLFKTMFLERKEMKKIKDPREYVLKICLNSSYGAISNPVFKNIYSHISASDCTSLGQQFILYARKRFREEGYENIFSDTDSIGIKIPEGKTKQDAQDLAEIITKELLSHLPFPW